MSGKIPMLKAEKVTRKFGELVAVNEVSLEIPKGEIHALIGSNGAGKTTFMDTVVHRVMPTSGKIWFDGEDITGISPELLPRKGMCKCFQITKLFMKLTVFENVRIALISRRGSTYDFFPKKQDWLREEVAQILENVGILHLIDQTVAFLSYGDQRRVEVATTLAMNPKFLMLDEPTAGVARAEGYAIMDMVYKLAKEEGLTVLYIEHDMDIVFNYADHISVMHNGVKLATDIPSEIRQNDFVKNAYLGGLE